VYAIEVQKDLLENIRRAASSEGLDNIETLWGDVEEIGGSKLGDSTADVVVISNLLFQAEDKSGVIKEASRVLKPGGKLAIIDWSDSYGNLGPTPDMVFDEEDAKKLLSDTDFTSEGGFDAGEHHYGLIYIKNT
jgi:ubiquinone/menaquinone biosynthesis C-methylase UbiE